MSHLYIVSIKNSDQDMEMDLTRDLQSPSMSSESEQGSDEPVKRKRQRLTHLTAEEKMSRRKLKNRVAAQSARDRKKAKMEDLEETLIVLRKENEKLKCENEALKQREKVLMAENRKLLEIKSVDKLDSRGKHKIANLNEVEGSAEFFRNVSLPKKQLHLTYQRMLVTLILYLTSLIQQQQQQISSSFSPFKQSSLNHQTKVAKLKQILIKLIRLLKLHRMTHKIPVEYLTMRHRNYMFIETLARPPSLQYNNKYNNMKSQQAPNASNLKAMMLFSLVMKLMNKK